MKKINISDLDGRILKQETDLSCIYERNRCIYKILKPYYLHTLDEYGIDIEAKLLYNNQITDFDELVLPTGIVYSNGKVVGYEMEKVKGTNYNQIPYDSTYTLMDYANLYYRFEKIMKKASDNGIVITDFTNCSNILFLDEPNKIKQNNPIKILDYNDMQVGEHRTFVLSESIAVPLTHTIKYRNPITNLYTPELNKLSLLILYFADALCLNLANIQELSGDKEDFSITEMLNLLGLDDDIIGREISKVCKQNVPNPYYSDIFYRIAELYRREDYTESDEILTYKLVRK